MKIPFVSLACSEYTLKTFAKITDDTKHQWFNSKAITL